MKNLLLFCTVLLLSSYSKADAWDNLTMEEAQAVVTELEKNPFIFDYCDCCDDDGPNVHSALLLRVVNTEIVTCDWNTEFYSVKYQATAIAEVSYNDGTISLLDAKEGSGEFTLYMNYSRGLNSETKKATNFFNIVAYDYYGDTITCKDEFNFPQPKALKEIIKVRGYKKWYKRNIL